MQVALGRLRAEGRSLQTLNHHRGAVVQFARWCYDTDRVREMPLRKFDRYNHQEDRRHDRRTVSVEEMRRLILVAQNGEPFKSMTGPMRALLYRLAVSSGLRYSELGSIRPESFNWTANPPTVQVDAAHSKNGQTATFPLSDDLAEDLSRYVAAMPNGLGIFPLPKGQGAEMLRHDLEPAGIPYRDAAGLVFDFHSLRCETATLLDASGVSPRLVQRIMRHSDEKLTNRYTRPRIAEIEAAAGMLPDLRPQPDEPRTLAATGTYSVRGATENATFKDPSRRNLLTGEGLELSTNGSHIQWPGNP
jgi:integrase